jgi:hypothetical protein
MRRLLAIFFTLVLAGCSTLGITDTGSTGAALDPSRDDIGNMLVAFDLPRGLGPVTTAELFTFDVPNGGPSEHLRLTLVPADADAVSSRLPPPADGRAYYLFGVRDQDKPAIQAAQAAAQAAGIPGSAITIGIVPHLCTSGPVDPNTLTVSVYALMPGQTRMTPFLDNELLADVQKLPGSTQMPPCV